MNSLDTSFAQAFQMVIAFDPDLYEIIGLSLQVSLQAVLYAACIGVPIGASLVIFNFPGKRILEILTTTLMGLPPVLVGLFVYLMLSRAGPLGELGILYTPQAMIVAQTILITPIIAALSREAIKPIYRDYAALLRSLGASKIAMLSTLIKDARYGIMTALLAGFGRAIAEVGAVMIVGGNINHHTRVMTTTIALETSKGALGLALGLGFVLLLLALSVNLVGHMINQIGSKYERSDG